MGLWRRLFPKTTPVVCPGCGGEPDPFVHPLCDSCWTGRRMAQIQRERAAAREQRIEELTEALRRAFPNGPYGRG